MKRSAMNTRAAFTVLALSVGVGIYQQTAMPQGPSKAAKTPDVEPRAVLNQYCVGCHNEKLKIAGLMLDKMDPSHVGDSPADWEKVIRKVRAGLMPPAGAPRPDKATLDTLAARIGTELDAVAAAHPNPGTTGLHRLNRTEYANAIRDLLAVEVDAASLLPADDSSEGFDNIADALGVSPALLERYVSAATKISRLAVGDPSITPVTNTYRVPGTCRKWTTSKGFPLARAADFFSGILFPWMLNTHLRLGPGLPALASAQ